VAICVLLENSYMCNQYTWMWQHRLQKKPVFCCNLKLLKMWSFATNYFFSDNHVNFWWLFQKRNHYSKAQSRVPISKEWQLVSRVSSKPNSYQTMELQFKYLWTSTSPTPWTWQHWFKLPNPLVRNEVNHTCLSYWELHVGDPTLGHHPSFIIGFVPMK
jgi:hypothetical protein